jgi:hypothetical protein
MDASALTHCQDTIVATLARSIAHEWDHALVNIEIDVVDGEQTENCLMVSFQRRGAEWVRSSEQLPFECYDQFVQLRQLLAPEDGPWTICTLEFNSSGKYRFSFSQDSPPRLSGIHDDQSMFRSYLPTPL